MAKIGSIPLEVDGVMSCGIAQLLITNPTKNIEYGYAGAVFRCQNESPYIVCCIKEPLSKSEVLERGNNLIQIGLDMLSMTGRADLATKNINHEYVLWWREGEEIIFSYFTTHITSVEFGDPPLITVNDKEGNVVPNTPSDQKHHLGYRFYRLSQISEDLFGAYRNMYLAFEYLLSSKYPKLKEFEIQWLTRALEEACKELELDSIVSKGTENTVKYIIDTIYQDARNPLFHAKNGKSIFTPIENIEEQRTVSQALDLLSNLVAKMSRVWFNTRRMGGWFNEDAYESHYPKTFATAHLMYTDIKITSANIDLKSEIVTSNTNFKAKFSSQFNGKKQANVVGRLSLGNETSHTVTSVLLRNNENVLFGFVPEAQFELTGFDYFEVSIIIGHHNAGQPKYLFSR